MFQLQFTKKAFTITPTINQEVGSYDWSTSKMGKAINEPDELCQCGRKRPNEIHADDCDDARAERFNALREKLNRKHAYIELEVA